MIDSSCQLGHQSSPSVATRNVVEEAESDDQGKRVVGFARKYLFSFFRHYIVLGESDRAGPGKPAVGMLEGPGAGVDTEVREGLGIVLGKETSKASITATHIQQGSVLGSLELPFGEAYQTPPTFPGRATGGAERVGLSRIEVLVDAGERRDGLRIHGCLI